MESEAGDTVYWYKIMYHQYFFCILILNHLNKNKSNICPKQTFWFGEEMQSIWLTKLSWIYTRPLKMVKLRGDHFHLKISSGGGKLVFYIKPATKLYHGKATSLVQDFLWNVTSLLLFMLRKKYVQSFILAIVRYIKK